MHCRIGGGRGGQTMLYQAYQLQEDLIAPMRAFAQTMRAFSGTAWWGFSGGDSARLKAAAALELVSRFQLTHTRPDFGIDTVMVGNRDVPVTPGDRADAALRHAAALRQGHRHGAAESAGRGAAVRPFRHAAAPAR